MQKRLVAAVRLLAREMNSFRSIFQPSKADFSINHQDKILLIGSCFSQNIGNKLIERQWNSMINPYGILYNPISIFNYLEEIQEEKKYASENIDYHNSIYHSKNHHSDFSSLDEGEIIRNINNAISKSASFLQETNVLILTFGTAWVYEYEDKIVTNCHKVPAKNFTKRRLTVQEIIEKAEKTITRLREQNASLKIILTVSPVRHLKDGFEENQISKSVLRLAIDEIITKNISCTYFPSYELMLDDLRDYRFYKKDRVHPNEEAIDYIWEHFSNTFFSEKTQQLNQKIEKINQGLAHRPQFPESKAHQDFLQKMGKEIAQLESLDGIHFQKK